MDVGRPGCRLDFRLGRIFTGIQQVDADRIVEQVSLLGHHANLGGQGGKRDIPQIHAVDQDAPAGRIIQPGNEIGQGSLAGPAWSHQRHQLARFGPE